MRSGAAVAALRVRGRGDSSSARSPALPRWFPAATPRRWRRSRARPHEHDHASALVDGRDDTHLRWLVPANRAQYCADPPGPAPAGMVWIPGGEFSMGAGDPPDLNDVGMNAMTRLAADSSRVCGRLLDGPDRRHQQAVRGVRACDGLCDDGRAEAAGRGLSRRASRRISSPVRSSSRRPITRYRSTTTFSGGRT